jgi:eukaryotic-like serine/threonine-protein kinase
MGTRPSAPGAPVSKTRARLEELEDALRLVRAERRGQLSEIEDELHQLQRIYQRMTTDLEALRAERDQAIEEARLERERRARETLELSERLEKARRTDEPSSGEPPPPEKFVQARLQATAAEHRSLQPGELPQVPGYRVLAPLGQGGMATVYHAVTEKDARDVAVKLLHDGVDASPGRIELFLREAAAMLQLSHPGLVRALDAGDCTHGRFLVLELVRGESLAALVRRNGPLAEKEAIRVGLQVARALSYCARLGLTHRDVKPSNLLTDASGRVRLCDFGLAALSFGADPARPYGSPGYAAPEQISNPTSVDERVDIYALGSTLWHLVVGRRPFQGTPKQVFELQRAQDLTDPRFEGADISPRFAQVIRRMGRALRERRYRRWDECILDLMLVENGNPPFSAHLAEALEPGGAARVAAAASEQPGATPSAPPPPSVPAVSPVAPPPGLAAPPEIPHGDVLPLAPKRLRSSAIWLLVAAVGAAGATFGYGVSQMARRTTADDLEIHALRRAADGDPRGAAAALRSAASVLDGPDRDRLAALALSLEERAK